jgi:hypothetical protein
MTDRKRTRRRTLEPTIGVDLAAELCDTAAAHARARAKVVGVLFFAAPSWNPRIPENLGWSFTEPRTIHVFGVEGARETANDARMEAVARQLQVRGFTPVVIHDHAGPAGTMSCGCRMRAL